MDNARWLPERLVHFVGPSPALGEWSGGKKINRPVPQSRPSCHKEQDLAPRLSPGEIVMATTLFVMTFLEQDGTL